MNSTLRMLAITAIAASFSIMANATPGKLNSSGCHNSKKAGYHCHRAQPSANASKSKKGHSKPAGAPSAPASASSRPRQ